MAVETLSGEYATAYPRAFVGAGVLQVAFGRYNFGTTAVEDGDIRKVLQLPGKCLVHGGELVTGDLDSGTETIDIDLGWAAAGGSDTWTDPRSGIVYTNAAASADPDGFINSGVLTGDAITDLKAAGINWRPILLPTGPLYFSHVTTVQLEVNAGAATPADAQAWVKIYLEMI